MIFCIEDSNIFMPQEKKYVDETILGSYFPFYWIPHQVRQDEHGWFSHTLLKKRIEREDEGYKVKKLNDEAWDSPHGSFFINIIKRFCKKHQLSFTHIYRGCLNLTIKSHARESSPHIDHTFPHKSMIIYLNKSEGETVILKNRKIIKKIKPIPFKMLCFDGLLNHYIKYPSHGRRVIGVFTFN